MELMDEFEKYEDMIISRLLELQVEVCERVVEAYKDTSKSIVSILQYSGETKKTLESLLLRERKIAYEKLMSLPNVGEFDKTLVSKYTPNNTLSYLKHINKKVDEKFKSLNKQY